MFERIIISLDGSEISEIVIPYTVEIAKRFNSQIDIIGIGEGQENPLDRLFHNYLEEFAAKFKTNGINAGAIHLHGNPSSQILDYAHEKNADLIIMATRGRTNISKWTMGSVAEKVLRATDKPLLLVSQEAPRIPKGEVPVFKRILVPLDGSDMGEAALPFAVSLCCKTNARLYILYIMLATHRITGGIDYAVRLQQQLMETLRKQARDYLNKVAADLDRENLDIKYDLVSGYPSMTILDYAKSNAIDMISLSSHGKGGMDSFTMGSTTDKVVHNSEKPVLLVKWKKVR